MNRLPDANESINTYLRYYCTVCFTLHVFKLSNCISLMSVIYNLFLMFFKFSKCERRNFAIYHHRISYECSLYYFALHFRWK